jgi:Uma2 family endonuclease
MSGAMLATLALASEGFVGSATKISFEEFQRLQETSPETERYELDEGELIATPSPAPRHSIVSFRLRRALTEFVQAHRLGVVIGETDFRLNYTTVRAPDVAFITRDQMKSVDFDCAPIPGAPALAIEVISPSNLAQDARKKVRQYLNARSQAVWLVYPELRVVEIHDAAGIHDLTESQPISEERLLPGHTFHLSLTTLFDDDPER